MGNFFTIENWDDADAGAGAVARPVSNTVQKPKLLSGGSCNLGKCSIGGKRRKAKTRTRKQVKAFT